MFLSNKNACDRVNWGIIILDIKGVIKLFEFVENKVNELEPLLIGIRRYLHQYPELSGQEYDTANYIESKLKGAGIETEILNTNAGPAVIGYLGRDKDKETIAFRSDMDALPLIDHKNKPYSSKNEGAMHACGHDFHMVSVLGTALVLASIINKLDINIKFIFQPAEEIPKSGAEALVKMGVMDGVNSIFTIHALPTLEAGKIAVKYGTVGAAIDFFKLAIKGSGGHSARPHAAIDSIFIASQILNSIYSDISRMFDPLDPVVISVGKIKGGSAPNIIADSCEVEGTVRSFDQNLSDKVQLLLRERIAHLAKTYGANTEVEWHRGTPFGVNDMTLAKLTEDSAAAIIGAESVEKNTKPSMGADDFAQYLFYAPGMLIRIGTGGEDATYPLHSNLFDINEKAIAVAVKVLSTIAVNFSNSKLYLQKWADNIAS